MKLNLGTYSTPFGQSAEQSAYTPFIDRMLDQIIFSKHIPSNEPQDLSSIKILVLVMIAFNLIMIYGVFRPQTKFQVSNDRRLMFRSYLFLSPVLLLFLFLDLHLFQVIIYAVLTSQPSIGVRLLGFPQRYGPMRDIANALIMLGIFDTRVMAFIFSLYYIHFFYTLIKALFLHFHPIRLIAAINFIILIEHIINYPGGAYKLGTTILLHYSTFILLTLAPYKMSQVYSEYYGDWMIGDQPRKEVMKDDFL